MTYATTEILDLLITTLSNGIVFGLFIAIAVYSIKSVN